MLAADFNTTVCAYADRDLHPSSVPGDLVRYTGPGYDYVSSVGPGQFVDGPPGQWLKNVDNLMVLGLVGLVLVVAMSGRRR